ncbi:DUF1549 and DUF1553 domain-containing protein [Tuwongella immobilis]|uniref:BIG2 domain-containing protein n=1 Tax=Tuwongella immobilis TaxID=692036 RepID=A0A6C2YHK5_9BACT|nr:DUF1549 and DUF1553 domain-containing protein [Tuwongella immobilis]VIP00844.1 Uncharacterized protein OS=Singulisphaera acidiphila (strain ATCC BAA-1392 / DSM 18658 / VKM B-2454 / MOB10) GN=Sinac_5386 PE=4 SV=1: PSCyt2: PSD1 [Tuwongella immobilis]VTR97106.1 Uncharacterized protein OS=Singulisphaera acidiphila (strain ATCC BAA-1392 / DSM 18658 / VKM B-2454 / MOB10) GN=Sinac_5386 PE=4 SV=1: PSCyt2: PSD1 [Tuwongella immobilis]
MFRFVLGLLLICSAAVRAETPAAAPVPSAALPTTPPTKLQVFPAEITLDGPRAEQRLIVLGEFANGVKRDLSEVVSVRLANPALAEFRDGTLLPKQDGQTTVTIQFGGISQTLPMTVVRSQADLPVDFIREIEPILTKSGCNGGGCHGAALGRGGFRLSLFGFDPAFDHAQIVQSAEGRRIVLEDAERSILLAKPALQMEHGGGEKLKLNGRDYVRLRQWLEDGAPEPIALPAKEKGKPAEELTVKELLPFPASRVMVPGETQQLAITAVWNDGRREDVTAVAQFDALNESVAAVTSMGRITAKSTGESAVMVRFGGQAAIVTVSLPFARLREYPQLPRNNFVDDRLIAKWRDLGLTPSPLANDETFLRRMYLDVLGRLPTPEEIRAFLADSSPEKRAKAIDAALDKPEFVDFWSLKWGDLLRINRDALTEKGMWSFHNWVRSQMRDGVTVDAFVRDIITAEGSTYTDGPANFYRTGRNPEEWAESVAQVFMGVRMQCAKCHHHPFEKWSQDDYYGLTAFFARLSTKNSTEFGIFGRESVIFIRDFGEVSHPRKKGFVAPRPLDGPAMDDDLDRRRKLADWLTTPENPFFARNLVNRFWGYLMGRGLVEPLDDMRQTNPACNPELLDALAADFARSGYQLKHILRTILNSRAYQLDSHTTPGNAADALNTHFARAHVKRLTAEQLADALDFATGTQEKYTGLPLGTKAVQLPDSRVQSYIMDVFGRPARQVVCECERTTQPNIAQALHLMNGDFLNNKIARSTGRVESLAKARIPAPLAIQELYLVTLSRLPRPDEVAKAQGWIANAPTPREGLQDLLWALLNSKEFLFNH